MLVRDTGDAWQLVLQTNHGELAGQFARAWSPRPEPFRSLEVVARRHDDGWFLWERGPTLDPDGRPANFLDVPVPLHLSFYRATIEAVCAEDAYAGLVLSLHGAGIYKYRYGLQGDLRMRYVDDVAELAGAFVAEQEARADRLRAELGVEEDEAWRSYRLLQAWDRLSLYACLNDIDEGAPGSIPSVPLDGDEATLELTPTGARRIAVDPYPFARAGETFDFERRTVPKRDWADDNDFREDFFAAAVEPVTLAVEPA